jgi:phosphopantothenoylcysteine decarboxylase/phosphopantothenate--cysteine ligase
MLLKNKHILLGVTGSISCYKACDLVRRLQDQGAIVRVVMTQAAAQFVSPMTFEALSAHPVVLDALAVDGGRIHHVEAAHWAEVMVIAPATADTLARLVHGRADDALGSTALAFSGPLVIAPAMEDHMWSNAATQQNVSTIQQRGAKVVPPLSGRLASGREGMGRLAAVGTIVDAVIASTFKPILHNKHILITAGPTVEKLDPVRAITNRSSGKMGVAVARAAGLLGAKVELVHGPLSIALPATENITFHRVTSADEMAAAVHALLPQQHTIDIAVHCAAVADRKPKTVAPQKIKKSPTMFEGIEWVPTIDILASMAQVPHRESMTIIGFAAETNDIENYAQDKLTRKACDVICANDVSKPDQGFEVDTNALTLFFKDGTKHNLPPQHKMTLALELWNKLIS